jgi:membrane protease YdiL (CAAX protease family)
MHAITSLVRRWPLVTFFGLAYALSWWPSLVQPHGILPLGPLVAAVLLLPLVGGRPALSGFLRRIVRYREHPRWYALALGLPPAIAALAVWLNRLSGAAAPIWDHVPAIAGLPPVFLMMFVVIGLGEEPAWRGYALPRLVASRGVAGGIVVLGLLHVLWHLPLFGLEYDLQTGPPWALSVMAYTAITAWLYVRTDGNLLLPALMHASVNTSARFLLLPLFQGSDVIHLRWIWAALWITAAAMPVLDLNTRHTWHTKDAHETRDMAGATVVA